MTNTPPDLSITAPRRQPPLSRSAQSDRDALQAATFPSAVASAISVSPAEASVLTLRLSTDFHQIAAGKPVLVEVPVAKPPKHAFFQTSQNIAHSISLCTLDAAKMGGSGVYAVSAEVAARIPDQVRNVELRLAVTAQGAPYLVPIPHSGADGRQNPWHLSLARAMALAKGRWIRLSANQLRGAYDVFEALGELPEPQWPTESFDELVELAFKDRVITSVDHPLIQQLLGFV
ncbi:hypothetical protein [Uliginosibacterium sp. 31-12]|uniref:hypothetical protein n=1 Tax=Uliginosibacterium sp. 31-12 TaxID=3062781 RepID=UPI0026E142A7|nr:hypothetical protein [Uliginosibacterium sp. 31-12]MDO6384700.1 hypothetical protein [Uliginosibacterium sp. 31-12]